MSSTPQKAITASQIMHYHYAVMAGDMTRKEMEQKIDEILEAFSQNRLVAIILEVEGCFVAAEAEGLSQVLDETTDERLKDLVERRLMYAYYAVIDQAPQVDQVSSNSELDSQTLGELPPPSGSDEDRTRFMLEFNRLGFLWSDSNIEKAYLGWKLLNRALHRPTSIKIKGRI